MLLVRCRPWLVALPLADVVRITDTEAGAAEGGVGAAEGGSITFDGQAWRLASLAVLLGTPRSGDANWEQPVAFVLTKPKHSAGLALATGRCLRVGPLPGVLVDLPACAFRHRRPTPCFPAGDLATTHGLAPFGLFLDPAVHFFPAPILP